MAACQLSCPSTADGWLTLHCLHGMHHSLANQFDLHYHANKWRRSAMLHDYANSHRDQVCVQRERVINSGRLANCRPGDSSLRCHPPRLDGSNTDCLSHCLPLSSTMPDDLISLSLSLFLTDNIAHFVCPLCSPNGTLSCFEFA